MSEPNLENARAFDPRCSQFRSNPYPAYRDLQESFPVFRRPGHEDWIVTRYADVDSVLKSKKMGRGHRQDSFGLQSSAPKIHLAQLILQQGSKLMSDWAVLQNPPAHTTSRRQIHHMFAAPNMKLLSRDADRRVVQCISSLPEVCDVDLIAQVAFPIAMRMNSQILGLTEEDQSPKFRQWTDEISLLTDIQPDGRSALTGSMALASVAHYFQVLLDQRDGTGRQGLMGHLSRLEQQGEIVRDKVISTLVFMFSVGHSSTVNLMGNSIFSLLSHPQQLRYLRENPIALDDVLTEVLRFESPVQAVSRTALADTEIGGQVVKKGEIVHLVIGAANRDPARFTDPDRFDATIKRNSNLSFGAGIHNCIGLKLASLTTKATVRALLSRYSISKKKRRAPNVGCNIFR